MSADRPQWLSRRSLLGAVVLGGAAHTLARADPLKPPPRAPPPRAPFFPALTGQHAPRPLPFAPASLRGLSERLIVSHHDNNYVGAVRNLNRCEAELAALKADTPPFVVAALHERALTFRNSKTLHEAYFANLGGDGKAAGAVEVALGEAFGTRARWEEHFRAAALGLAGGSGWVVLALALEAHALVIVGAANHAQALAAGVPLLVLDMYEHAYHLDYGAAAARYVDAFFANIAWAEVERRLAAGERAATAWAR